MAEEKRGACVQAVSQKRKNDLQGAGRQEREASTLSLAGTSEATRVRQRDVQPQATARRSAWKELQ